jgi:hypothetical protein
MRPALGNAPPRRPARSPSSMRLPPFGRRARDARGRRQGLRAGAFGPADRLKPAFARAGAGKASYGSLAPINPPITCASALAIRPAVSLSATWFSSATMRRSCASFFAARVASMVSTLACQRPYGEAANWSGGRGYPGPQSIRPGPGRPPIAGVEPPHIVPWDAGAVPWGKPLVGVAGRETTSVAGKPSIAVLPQAGWGARAGFPAIGGAAFGAVGQDPALRRARRAR